MIKIALVIHNVRSTHNVGSLLRTADGLGVDEVLLTGYTPYPKSKNDNRLPHLANKIHYQIHKTALGAEETVNWQHIADINDCIKQLRTEDFKIVALEQTSNSIPIQDFKPPKTIALIVGTEVEGLDDKTLQLTDTQIEIPMLGQKESFNVSVAAAMVLYHLRYS